MILDRDTAARLQEHANEFLRETFVGEQIDAMLAVRALTQCKTVCAYWLMEVADWPSDDAWARVSKLEIEMHRGERGMIVEIKDV